MRVFGTFLFYLVLFLLQTHVTNISNGYGCYDNSYNSKRICTCVTICDSRGIGTENLTASLSSSTQARRVRNCTTKYPHHHGQIGGILTWRKTPVEEDQIVETYATNHIEQDYCESHQVQLDASLLHTLEKAWAHLQTNAIDKQNKSKILYEIQHIRSSRKAYMSC